MKLKMEFHEIKSIAGGRCGEIRFENGERQKIDTPACMLYTRGGAAPYITNELMEDFLDDYAGVHVTLPTLFQYPGPEALQTYGKGISEFLGIQKKHFVFMSVYDPTQEIQCSYNEEKNISVWNSGGRKKINVDHFIEILKSFKPDIAQCLCDTVPISGNSSKRNRKSVDRTLKFLDELLESRKNSDVLKSIEILGSVEGGDSETERIRSALETSKRDVAGFVVEGIQLSSPYWDVTITHEEVKTCIKNLPRNRPRFFFGPMTPDHIFSALECGIDVFDSSFAYEATRRGCSLNLQCSNKRCKPELSHANDVTDKCKAGQIKGKVLEENIGEDGEKSRYEMNIANIRYKEDFSSLVTGCSCYSCTNHTRAYIYHLLETKEMLAEVLLMVHNFHQYFSFFKKLREALNNDTYETFKQDFLRT